jgi:N-acetylglucosamine-6-phosphate deacetylase
MLRLEGVGALEPGLRADAVVLDAGLDVRRVLHRGRWVH